MKSETKLTFFEAAAIITGLAINSMLIFLITLTTLTGAGENVSEDGALVDLARSLGGWVSIVGYLFSLLALVTSFWANTLNLRDIVNEQTHWGVRLSWLDALPFQILILLCSVLATVGAVMPIK